MMHDKAGTLSFGPYLKAIREQQDIPLSAVASEIRVGLWQLTLIEAEDHDKLPDAVYVKGILKAYAACVGVDTDDILERYSVNRQAYENTLDSGDKEDGPGRDRSVRAFSLWYLLLAGAVISGLLVYVLTPVPVKTPGKVQAPPAPALNGGAHAEGPVPGKDRHAVKTGGLDLCVDALSETTINIQIDGVSNKRLHLYPRDHVEIKGSFSFNILISDSSAVDLTLNGEPVLFEKKAGRSVNLVLTGKGHKTDG